MRRTQIYLDPEQAREVAARARRRRTTASHVIREAIDEYLAQPGSEDERRLARFRAGLDDTFGAIPRLPEGTAYVADVRLSESDRESRLSERRGR